MSNSSNSIGVLLAQVGTPDSLSLKSVRSYLRDFLSDPRVIEAPRLIWPLVLYAYILPFRAKRSLEKYTRIWTPDGSPLLCITEKQTRLVSEKLRASHPKIKVSFGMRYSKPTLETALDELISLGCTRILLFPMYPHYSGSVTASAYDAVFSRLLTKRYVPTLRVAMPFFSDQRYLKATAHIINEGLSSKDNPPERLLLSYHGLPVSRIEQGDPYADMCTATTRGLYDLLHFGRDKVIHTYQSRFGRANWLLPSTNSTLSSLAKQGVKHVAIACPGFPADCLETLDEIGNESRAMFLNLGGESLELIPCPNDHSAWIDAICAIIIDEVQSWL